MEENRQNTRYKEIGRFLAAKLCLLPGIIDDVSIEGCKVHYQFPVDVEVDSEYEAQLSPSQNPSDVPLKLICKTQWVQKTDEMTYIGFKILYSPDGKRLSDFIQHLQSKNQDELPEIIN
ncbi:MAG: hypothetical protein K5829_01085 [Treponema sp.]|nr:hypothetical protein [Treponema sp.]